MHREKMQEQELKFLKTMTEMLGTIQSLFEEARHEYVMGHENSARYKLDAAVEMVEAFTKIARIGKC